MWDDIAPFDYWDLSNATCRFGNMLTGDAMHHDYDSA